MWTDKMELKGPVFLLSLSKLSFSACSEKQLHLYNLCDWRTYCMSPTNHQNDLHKERNVDVELNLTPEPNLEQQEGHLCNTKPKLQLTNCTNTLSYSSCM